MPVETPIVERYIAAAITFGIAVIIGLIVQLLVNTRLHKIALKTKWKGDEIIIGALRGRIILWSVVIGLYAALPMLELPPHYHIIIQKALLVLVILSITLAASSIMSGFIKVYSGEVKGEILSTSIFAIFSRIVVMSIGIMIILQSLDISITPILTALGVGGLAVALALQDTLGNLFAGLNILFSGKIKVGNYVKLQSGEEGYVADITWRSTTIRQLANNFIIIPNSKLAQSVTTNYHLPEMDMSIIVQIGVAYDSDLEKAEKVTIEVAREVVNEVEGAVPQRDPFIRYHTFGEYSINMSVIIGIQEYTKQYLIIHEFIKRIHARFQRGRDSDTLPVRTIEFAEGSKDIIAEGSELQVQEG